MPYIEKNKRDVVDQEIRDLADKINTIDKGTINYSITKMFTMLLRKNGTCYSNINDLIGVLECVKMEFYRKIAVEYEEEKEEDNGSISAY